MGISWPPFGLRCDCGRRRVGRMEEPATRWPPTKNPEEPNIEIQIWHRHFDSQQKIAKLVADSIAILPPVLLRALPINTVVGIDVGSGTGAIYWNLLNERAHVIEFAAVFAHESDDTLDWAFEELLLHEIGHVFDVGLYKISENAGWLNASNEDLNALVSEYAATNAKEAFAETFAAWVSFSRDAARPENERRLTHVHRTHILDSILYGSSGFLVGGQRVAGSSILPTRRRPQSHRSPKGGQEIPKYPTRQSGRGQLVKGIRH